MLLATDPKLSTVRNSASRRGYLQSRDILSVVGTRCMKLRYFAWVRERIGKVEEMVEPPASVRTVSDLIGWLTTRGDEYAYAFEKPNVIRAAIDHSHVNRDTSIAGACEVAFFPPMTGG
jgi:sulfur-carrier protein